MQAMTSHEQAAYDLGVEHAKNAASWVLDGNTSEDHIRRMVAMLDDGDPEAEQYLPARPDLSGEWADSMTPDVLHREITGGEEPREDDSTFQDELCSAYERGVDETFQVECERILRAALPDTSEDPSTEHGYDVCPDCGNVGTKITAAGYVPCTRFLTCWADPS